MYAALTNRDGIVGRFPPPPYAALALKAVDTSATLPQWEPWVRAQVLDVEALQGLSFRPLTRGFQLLDVAGHVLITVHRPSNTQGMDRQVQLVADWAAIRQDRAPEILSQTPQLLTYWAGLCGLQSPRTKHTLELMATLLRLTIAIEMRFKHALAFPRPFQFSPAIQPIIQTPGHSSFPSGHSTEAHAIATLLAALASLQPTLFPHLPALLLKQAARIAINRTVAGVHFPIDSRAGRVLGMGIAHYFLARCGFQRMGGDDTPAQCYEFDAEQALTLDFVGPNDQIDAGFQSLGTCNVGRSDLLHQLLTDAIAEWAP